MKRLNHLFFTALASGMAIHLGAAEPDGVQSRTTAPVLRPTEPADNVVLRLPGASAPKRPVAPAPAPAAAALPVNPPAPATAPTTMPAVAEKPAPVSRPVETANRLETPKRPLIQADATAAAPQKPEAPAKPAPPPEFTRDSARFCQGQIGHWKQSDARALLGAPRRQRPSFDDNNAANGRIYAFSDPTGRYKEIELDFDNAGKLRTVYGYPPKLTWKKCQELWGSKFESADAKEGRTFYSYLNRRLDVLVDPNGNVISLGLY